MKERPIMRKARLVRAGTGTVVTGIGAGAADAEVQVGGELLPSADFSWTVPFDGLVYGVVLNDRDSLERLGQALSAPPYKVPPSAPILYVKPYNTHTGHGAHIRLPVGARAVEVGATLGIVFGADASHVPENRALEYVDGYTIVADLSLPHASYYRPAIREKCFDGACPAGPWLVSRDELPDPHAVPIRTYVDGRLVDEHSLADAVRRIPRLIADVSEFMTLKCGDVLLCGVRYQAPTAAAGSKVEVEIEGIGRLAFQTSAAGAE
jgi:5-oxopent-3-ene-1,2,5-tricarboxylate decarboxylase/2-hydroxyhepta-2,4-diene-1,7-dioate isomerase